MPLCVLHRHPSPVTSLLNSIGVFRQECLWTHAFGGYLRRMVPRSLSQRSGDCDIDCIVPSPSCQIRLSFDPFPPRLDRNSSCCNYELQHSSRKTERALWCSGAESGGMCCWKRTEWRIVWPSLIVYICNSGRNRMEGMFSEYFYGINLNNLDMWFFLLPSVSNQSKTISCLHVKYRIIKRICQCYLSNW